MRDFNAFMLSLEHQPIRTISHTYKQKKKRHSQLRRGRRRFPRQRLKIAQQVLKKSHKEILIYSTKQENELNNEKKRGKAAYHAWMKSSMTTHN